MTHLHDEEIMDFIAIHSVTPESLQLMSRVNGHIANCDMCRERLNAFCDIHEELQRLGSAGVLSEDPALDMAVEAAKSLKKELSAEL